MSDRSAGSSASSTNSWTILSHDEVAVEALGPDDGTESLSGVPGLPEEAPGAPVEGSVSGSDAQAEPLLSEDGHQIICQETCEDLPEILKAGEFGRPGTPEICKAGEFGPAYSTAFYEEEEAEEGEEVEEEYDPEIHAPVIHDTLASSPPDSDLLGAAPFAMTSEASLLFSAEAAHFMPSASDVFTDSYMAHGDEEIPTMEEFYVQEEGPTPESLSERSGGSAEGTVDDVLLQQSPSPEFIFQPSPSPVPSPEVGLEAPEVPVFAAGIPETLLPERSSPQEEVQMLEEEEEKEEEEEEEEEKEEEDEERQELRSFSPAFSAPDLLSSSEPEAEPELTAAERKEKEEEDEVPLELRSFSPAFSAPDLLSSSEPEPEVELTRAEREPSPSPDPVLHTEFTPEPVALAEVTQEVAVEWSREAEVTPLTPEPVLAEVATESTTEPVTTAPAPPPIPAAETEVPAPELVEDVGVSEPVSVSVPTSHLPSVDSAPAVAAAAATVAAAVAAAAVAAATTAPEVPHSAEEFPVAPHLEPETLTSMTAQQQQVTKEEEEEEEKQREREREREREVEMEMERVIEMEVEMEMEATEVPQRQHVGPEQAEPVSEEAEEEVISAEPGAGGDGLRLRPVAMAPGRHSSDDDEEEDEVEFQLPPRRPQEAEKQGFALNKLLVGALVLLCLGSLFFSDDGFDGSEMTEQELLERLTQENQQISTLEAQLQSQKEALDQALLAAAERGEAAGGALQENLKLKDELATMPSLKEELESLRARVAELSQLTVREAEVNPVATDLDAASPTDQPPAANQIPDAVEGQGAEQQQQQPQDGGRGDALKAELQRQKGLLEESRKRLEAMKKSGGKKKGGVREGLVDVQKRLSEQLLRLDKRHDWKKAQALTQSTKDQQGGKKGWKKQQQQHGGEKWEAKKQKDHEGSGQWKGEKEWKHGKGDGKAKEHSKQQQQQQHAWRKYHEEWDGKKHERRMERERRKSEKPWEASKVSKSSSNQHHHHQHHHSSSEEQHSHKHSHKDFWKHQEQKLQRNPGPSKLCLGASECAEADGLVPVELSEFHALLESYLGKLPATASASEAKQKLQRLTARFFLSDGTFDHQRLLFSDFAEDVADILEDLVEEATRHDDEALEEEMEEFEREALWKFAAASAA